MKLIEVVPTAVAKCCWLLKHFVCVAIIVASTVLLLVPRVKSYECGVPAIDPNLNYSWTADEWVVAKPNSWPWQALVYQDKPDGAICGGVLIDPNWIVTTGHCVNSVGQNVSLLRVKLGAHQIGNEEAVSPGAEPTDLQSQQILDVQEVIQHPNYNNRTLSFDVTLIRLARPARLAGFVLPICLPEPGMFPKEGDLAVVTGWGAVFTPPMYRTLEKLHQTIVEVTSKLKCKRSYRTIQLDDTVFCAVLNENDQDNCFIDFGSPLVIRYGQKWYLMGLMSWESCAVPGFPGLYSNVALNTDWLGSAMKATAESRTIRARKHPSQLIPFSYSF